MSQPEAQTPSANPMPLGNTLSIQLLGLSPILAVSDALSYGLALGLATLIVCVLGCFSASVFRRYIPPHWRIVWFMVILASYVTLLEILLQVYFYPLSLRLGIYLPLICCNTAILMRMETVAFHSPWHSATLDGLKAGLAFLLAITLFSACRELLTRGSLFYDWEILRAVAVATPETARNSSSQLFYFADTQAGAFILLGLLLAFINFVVGIRNKGSDAYGAGVEPIRRARVTGRLIREDGSGVTEKGRQ